MLFRSLWKKLPAVVAILGIVIITNRAMNVGLDGVVIAASVTAIAGLGGFYLRDLLQRGERR